MVKWKQAKKLTEATFMDGYIQYCLGSDSSLWWYAAPLFVESMNSTAGWLLQHIVHFKVIIAVIRIYVKYISKMMLGNYWLITTTFAA